MAFTDNDLDRYEIGEGLRDGRLGCFLRGWAEGTHGYTVYTSILIM